jgi:hypothetical protein
MYSTHVFRATLGNVDREPEVRPAAPCQDFLMVEEQLDQAINELARFP